MDFAQFSVKRWLAAVGPITLAEEGAYCHVCMMLYDNDGVLPDDDKSIARACRIPTWRWQRMKATLLARDLIEVKDGLISQRYVRKTINEANARSGSQRERAMKRWDRQGIGKPRRVGNVIEGRFDTGE